VAGTVTLARFLVLGDGGRKGLRPVVPAGCCRGETGCVAWARAALEGAGGVSANWVPPEIQLSKAADDLGGVADRLSG
jgi:hypothetical protein